MSAGRRAAVVAWWWTRYALLVLVVGLLCLLAAPALLVRGYVQTMRELLPGLRPAKPS